MHLCSFHAEAQQGCRSDTCCSITRPKFSLMNIPVHVGTIHVGDAAITGEGEEDGRGFTTTHVYLEKVGDILVLQTHGLGAAEGGICCQMDPLLLAPINSPVIAPMAMDFHLHIYCCSLTTLLCYCTMKSALLQRVKAPAFLQTADSVPAAFHSSWPTSLLSQMCNSMQDMHIANGPCGKRTRTYVICISASQHEQSRALKVACRA